MRAILVAGMAFGDESKGATVDWLTRLHGAPLVVRFNGGSNASHNVVSPEGCHHAFSQFGSGTLAGADTHLSRFMLLDPLVLAQEAQELEHKIGKNPYDRLTVDPSTIIITRYHVAANRAREVARSREAGGSGRHGSVGAGVGEAREDQIVEVAISAWLASYGSGDCSIGESLREKLRAIRARKLRSLREAFVKCPEAEAAWWKVADLTVEQVAEELVEAMRPVALVEFDGAWRGALARAGIAWNQQATVIFEGAQGILLDETHGFAPYNSWTDCTFRNADRVLDGYRLDYKSRHRLGVFRSYFTRHGPGPFPTESGAVQHQEVHNGAHPWMGGFRQGWFDGVLAEYAVKIAKPDGLVVTHMDWWVPRSPCCTSYGDRIDVGWMTASDLGKVSAYCEHPGDFIRWLEERVGKPVEVVSTGPTSEGFVEVGEGDKTGIEELAAG